MIKPKHSFLLLLFTLLLTLVSCAVQNNSSLTEQQLCKVNTITGSDETYNYYEAYKCDEGYTKSQNSNTVANSGRTNYYDEEGNLLCSKNWFGGAQDCIDSTGQAVMTPEMKGCQLLCASE